MGYVKLSELPSPPPTKTGWPWTEESQPLPATLPGGRPWPRITIVTPSYNQGRFIEETIRSVLLQDYPNLDYIIIDGGSTDSSVQVIQKYAPWLSYWVSERDRGQAHAVNKGFQKATGEFIGWLNSDDLYEPAILREVATTFDQNPGCSVVFGDCYFVNVENRIIGRLAAIDQPFERKLQLWRGWHVPQPSTFVRREVLETIGLLDETLDYALDYDWFLRVSERYTFLDAGRVISRYRIHGDSKTFTAGSNGDIIREGIRSSRRYWGSYRSARFWRMQGSLCVYRLRAGFGSRVKTIHAAIPRLSSRRAG